MKKHKHLIPIGILIGAQLYSLYIINTTNIVLGNKQYAGAVFVFISVILLLLKERSWSIYLTGISLVAGVFNFIAFMPVIETYSFGIGSNGDNVTGPKIQVFSLLVLITYLLANYKALLALARKPLESKQ